MGVWRALFGEEASVLREKDFQLLLLAAALVPFGNGLLSPILDSLIDPFGATAANIGLMISVFWLPSVLITPFIGIVADRIGRKRILVPSLFVFGVGGCAIAFTTDFQTALLLRLLQGFGWAGIMLLLVTSIGDLYRGPREATAQGIRETGTNISGALIAVLAGILVIVAWHVPFLLYALAIPVAAALHLWLDEPTGSECDASEMAKQDDRPYRVKLLELLRRRRPFAIVVARSLAVVVWIGFTTYNSIIVVQLLEGTPAQAGVMFALSSMAVALAASQAGRATAAIGPYPMLLGANVCLGGGFIFMVGAPGLVAAAVGATVLGAGFGMALPLYRSLLTGFASTALRAGLVSAGATGARVAGMLTPIGMGGIIAGFTPTVGFAPAVQLAAIGAAVVGGIGGLLCVLVATYSPPVPHG